MKIDTHIGGDEESICLEIFSDIYLNEKCSSNAKILTMAAFHDTILLGGVGTHGLMNNATMNTKN